MVEALSYHFLLWACLISFLNYKMRDNWSFSTCSLEDKLRFLTHLLDSVIPFNDPWMSSQSDSSLTKCRSARISNYWYFNKLRGRSMENGCKCRKSGIFAKPFLHLLISAIIACYDLYEEIWIFEPLAIKKDMGRPIYLKNIEHLK